MNSASSGWAKITSAVPKAIGRAYRTPATRDFAHTRRMDPRRSSEPRGIVVDGDERAPTPSVAAIGGAAGAVWGLLCYSILWHGEPVGVQRPFVESLGGTLALLPARAVLWAIHVAEELAGRPFALADDHWWIG